MPKDEPILSAVIHPPAARWSALLLLLYSSRRRVLRCMENLPIR